MRVSNINYKRLGAAALAWMMAFIFVVNVNAAESMLYEDKKSTVITSGVIYDKVTRMYDRGWMNFYALKIDIKNPNVKLDVISSIAETGLKETVESLAKSNGVLAAVNGDFFGNTAVSSSMGIVIENGAISETRNYYNTPTPSYAGLYVDNDRNPFIDYLKVSHIGFLTNGTSKIELVAKNKVTDMKKPIYINRTAMTTTENLDKRFKNLYKIIVENNVIKDISAAGTVVTVPENGFLIVMDSATAVNVLKNFSVGDTASYYETIAFTGNSSITKDKLQFGISGGGKILEAGVTKDTGLLIEPHERHPRTVVGLNKDKTELVLIAIDGRTSNSLGATHYEAAEILREYGAWDAFHLDGGGSTTVVVRNEGDTALSVENYPSEKGVQRKIPNAVGITSTNGPGQLAGMYIWANGEKEGVSSMATLPVQLKVAGYDANYNPVQLGQVNFKVEGIEGTFSGDTFTPQSQGMAAITAESGGVSAVVTVNVLSPPQGLRLTPHVATIKNGEAVNFKAELVNGDGYGVDVTGAIGAWGTSSPIGVFDGKGKFTANQNGTTKITASYYSYQGEATVAVGSYPKEITNFEKIENVTFMPITQGVTGSVAHTTAIKHDGAGALELTYSFKKDAAANQIAGINFKDAGTTLEGAPKAFGFWLTGDGANSTVNAIFTDSLGNEKSYGFSAKMDNGDWKYYYQVFPDGLETPLKLSRITITSEKNLKADVNAKLYLDTIQASYDYKPDKAVMLGGVYGDYKYEDLTYPGNGYDITVIGPTAHIKTAFEREMFNKAVAAMQQNSKLSVFAGYTGQLPAMSTEYIRWGDAYEIKAMDNLRIINLASSKNGLRATNPQQWKSFINDLNANPINTIVVLNRDIWNNNYGFSDTKERDLLHKTLKEFKEDTGKDVIVVAGAGTDTRGYIIDGIRYVALNGLVSDGSADPGNFNILRVRVTEHGLNYDINGIN